MGHHNPGFLALVDDAKTRIVEVTIDDVKRMLDASAAFELVDVREGSEFDVDRLPRARHLCKGILERDVEDLIPDPHVEIVLYCGGGYRSALAADALQRMGYRQVRSMAGGIRAWRDAAFPLERP